MMRMIVNFSRHSSPPSSWQLALKSGWKVVFLVKAVLDDAHLFGRERPEKRPRFAFGAGQPSLVVRRIEDDRHTARPMDWPHQVICRCRDHGMAQPIVAVPLQVLAFNAPKASNGKWRSLFRIFRCQSKPKIFSWFLALGFVKTRHWHKTAPCLKTLQPKPAHLAKNAVVSGVVPGLRLDRRKVTFRERGLQEAPIHFGQLALAISAQRAQSCTDGVCEEHDMNTELGCVTFGSTLL